MQAKAQMHNSCLISPKAGCSALYRSKKAFGEQAHKLPGLITSLT